MKALITASLLLLTSTSAFAFSTKQVAMTMNDAAVQATLKGKSIESITYGPSYRCLGCFGLKITVRAGDGFEAYGIHGQEMNGREGVSIYKMEE